MVDWILLVIILDKAASPFQILVNLSNSIQEKVRCSIGLLGLVCIDTLINSNPMSMILNITLVSREREELDDS